MAKHPITTAPTSAVASSDDGSSATATFATTSGQSKDEPQTGGPLASAGLVRLSILVALTVGVVSGEVAVNASIAGAATTTEVAILTWSFVAAVALLPLGLIGYVDRWGHTGRTRSSRMSWIAGSGAVFELWRVVWSVDRLVVHVRRDASEPLTTYSLLLQTLIAGGAACVLAAIGVSEHRASRRREPMTVSAWDGRC